MPKSIRVPAFPYAAALSGARLAALHEETHDQHLDLIVDYDELQLSTPSELFHRDGKLSERVQGQYHPRRLRFIGVQALERTGLYTQLDTVPPEHSARSLRGLLHWRFPEADPSYLFINGSYEPAELQFTAQRYTAEARAGPTESADYIRDWSPAPPIPTRFMYDVPQAVHQRYGGDPIRLRLNQRLHHRRLFIGGLEYQSEQRPAIDAVLNLGEAPSRWIADSQVYPADRWANKGEGKLGMGVAEIIEEARWVIERLHSGGRVLVHCVAGFNRSVTVCCGVLILLENLSAEAALARVHQHHTWARPDSHHWLALRWLAHQAATRSV